MSRLPAHNLTQGKRPFWHAPLALLLYGLVVLAGVTPGASAGLPVKPYFIPKIERFVVVAPKGDSLATTTRNTDYGADGSDPHDPPWTSESTGIVNFDLPLAFSPPAMALPSWGCSRYLLQPSRAPPPSV